MTRSIPNSEPHNSRSTILCGLLITAIVGLLIMAAPSSAAAASFTVNSTIDAPDAVPGDGICDDGAGHCTLRAAVNESDFSGGANVITVPAGTYTLTLGPFDDEFNGAGATLDSGDLDIVDLSAFSLPQLLSVTINGAGAGSTIINGGDIDRVFDINNFAVSGAHVDVTFQNLTITNGTAPTSPDGYNEPGGGIQFDGFDNQTFVPAGTLTITNCNITNHSAAGQGGGILAIFGSLIVSGSTVSGNTSVNAAGGGIAYDGSAFPGLRTLQTTNSRITGNHANNGTFGSGGGVSEGGNANKTINYSVITNNTAGNQGGGVFNGGGDLTMNFNVIVDNTATAIPGSSGFRNNTGSINAENNWWGCNQGPSSAPCDRASGPLGSGIATWLKLSHTATPNAILVNQPTTLQADFFTNNTGTGISPSDLVALNGRTVTFNNAVLGTISGADPAISGGKANATFTAGGTAGNGSADATVDQATVTAQITITAPACPSLTALTSASIWIGLKNSDDVGTKFDLLAEVLDNGVVVGSGQLNDVPGGSSGFNNAVLRTISLALPSPQTLCPGSTLSIRLSVRIAASSGHVLGTARLWYNDSAANSRFNASIDGVATDYYLLDAFALGTSPGPGPKKTIDVLVNRNVGGNPFKPFGTWNINF